MRTTVAAIAAATLLSLPAAAQEAPPRISVTEAQLLTTFQAPGVDDPFWVLTLQHFSTWAYGSNFFFLDLADAPGLDFYEEHPGLYLEFAPVLSLGRLGVLPAGAGPLRDVGITAQINSGWTSADLEAAPFPISRVFLEGVELAWSVPGFAVFNTQLLARQESGYDGSWQLTWVYTLPLAAGGARAVVNGFLDVWRRDGGPEGEAYTVLLAQPQLLVGVGSNLQVGVEVEPSRNFPNAFVSDGWNVAVSPMVRWVF